MNIAGFLLSKQKGMITSKKRSDLLQESKREKSLFIHDGRRNNFPTSPFTLQSKHKHRNYLVFLAIAVKNKTLARF